jgi:hypothetical protein
MSILHQIQRFWAYFKANRLVTAINLFLSVNCGPVQLIKVWKQPLTG